ncbi:MAG TPA: caspase family protein [Candidatus Sulfotelmatobacter sp.]
MWKRVWLALASSCLLASMFPATAAAQARCGAGKDLMFQALERIRKGSSAEAENGVQLLRDATDLCPDLGDAWYYRSVFERKLNHIPKADFALKRATLLDSEALRDNVDPFALAAPPAGPASTGTLHDKWALIVGISKFADKNVPRLNYPSKDAQDFASMLKDPRVGRFKAEHVHILVDEEATTRHIKEELNWLARNSQPDDLVVIFVSSHGSPRELDSREVNYIVTRDTEVKPQDALFATALGMVELTQVVRSRILARRTAILLDTCHSGAAAGSKTAGAEELAEGSVSGDTLDAIRQGTGRAIISSSQAGESSYENDEAQNGYFTFYLIQALRQSNGMDPIQKVYGYVHDQVSKSVQTKFNVAQNPVLTRSDGDADIVIGAASGG